MADVNGARPNAHALIVYGGWTGHAPDETAALFADWLNDDGFEVTQRDTTDAFLEMRPDDFDLIVPIWTMGEITAEQCAAAGQAIAQGAGLAGCHGGMCDAFRANTEWQFLTGGQFVGHPGGDGVRYEVRITDPTHPITTGIDDFVVETEQYYMHIDPANHVLAETIVPPPASRGQDPSEQRDEVDGPHTSNGSVAMPVIWTRLWGRGRVFYNALGHSPEILRQPQVATLMKRGLRWAAGGVVRMP